MYIKITLALVIVVAFFSEKPEAFKPILGDDIIDNDGLALRYSGDLWCWLSHIDHGKRRDIPLQSKRMYKYCRLFYTPESKDRHDNRSTGWNINDEEGPSVDDIFSNPNQTVGITIKEYRNWGWGEPKRMTTYWCKTSGCNIPADAMGFLDYNKLYSREKQRNILIALGAKLEPGE